MSGPSKNTTTYSASDLQRYLKGEMSAREMHNLEMAALEDPFLADALEGFEKQDAPGQAQTGDQTLSGHLDDLRTRLDNRVSAPEKVAPAPASKLLSFRAPWLKIAAAAILLIGLGVTAWYGLLNKSNEPALVSQSKVPAATTAPLAAMDSAKIAPAPVDTQKTAQASAASLARAEKKTAAPPSLAARRAAAPALPTAPPPALSTAPSPADSITFIASKRTRDALASESVSIKKDSVAYDAEAFIQGYSKQKSFPDLSKSRLARIHPLVFSGKVLDVHNNPLPGATLFLAGPTGNNPIGTVTDLNGNFSLKVYPKDSVLKVTVGMVGYQQTSLAFNTLNTESSSGNLIHLAQQPNALDEVVVSGYGAKRKETRAMASSAGDAKIDSLWINAKPVMGKQAYLDYLAAGKKNIGADTSIKGAVIISFDVTKKGELTSFKVEQSLTPAHDAGVIHLISEGPPWKKVSKYGSVRTAVRVVF
jgi:hypothetical protein